MACSKDSAPKAGNAELPITSLLIDRALMTRPIDTGRVESLAAAIEEGITLPRVTVRYVDGRGYVVTGGRHGNTSAGGFHILKAYEAAGKTSVPCHVKPGTWEQAVVEAAGANREHDAGGLPRDDDAKGKAVLMVLSVHPEWSGPKIADATGTSPSYAGQIKTKFLERQNSDRATGSHCGNLDAGLSVEGKDGKTYRVAPSAPQPANEVGRERTRPSSRPEYVGEIVPSFRKNGAASLPLLPALKCPGCGSTVRDANPWPEVLAAHQFSLKSAELLLSRSVDGCEPFMLEGRMLTLEGARAAFRHVLNTVLGEVYGENAPFAEIGFQCLERAPAELLP